MAKRESLIGKVFGKLTVVAQSDKRVSEQIAWECICECSITTVVKGSSLRKGKTKSCGCLKTGPRGARLSTEDFIRKAISIHGDKYDYSETHYAGSQYDVSIICKQHGEFTQTAAIHLSGSGCQRCGWGKAGEAHKLCTSDFILAANKIHGDKYDYSQAEYTGCNSLVSIGCKLHGVFEQKPVHHLMSSECCPKCRSNVIDATSFEEKARLIHGDKYDYSLVEYTGSKVKVKIVCKVHGIFEQTPHNHTAGRHGCGMCAEYGFNVLSPASLYILSYKDITKVGITNRSVEDRAKQICRSSGIDFSIIKRYEGTGAACKSAETKLLTYLSGAYRNPTKTFDGYTECFINVDVPSLISMADSIFMEEGCKIIH